MPNSKHWADLAADRVIEIFPDRDKYICAAGITPSGTVHIGNFRDVITSDLVARALRDRKVDSELLLVWDNYDRLRNVPGNVPEEYERYIGMPISAIPSPYDNATYAEYFMKEFEQVLPEIGVAARIIDQASQYHKGLYAQDIKTAMQKRKEIAEILAKFRTQGMTESEKNAYYPYIPYCSNCRKDTTVIEEYDGDEEIVYICDCSKRETVNFTQKNVGKLSWKVDWAMRWGRLGVSFEPGGKDHASKGSSYDVSKLIAKEIFGYNSPIFLGYEFIGIEGASKMSSSSGNVVSLADILDIYEPEMVRFFFSNINPAKPITFYFGHEVIREYERYDRALRKRDKGKLSPFEKRVLEFARLRHDLKTEGNRAPFRKTASLGQIVQGDVEKLNEIFTRTGESYNQESVKSRLRRSQTWINKYQHQMKISLRSEPNRTYFKSLNPKEQAQILRLGELLGENPDMQRLTTLVYDIPKEEGMSNKEKKTAQKRFFKNCYKMLIDEDTGPRLPTFMIAIGEEKLKQLLSNINI